MRNIMHNGATLDERDMPAPRLELRWVDIEPTADDYYTWTVACIYSLVLKLGEHDIRRESVDEEGNDLPDVNVKVVEMGRTRSTGKASTRLRGDSIDTPFRDHAHAHWDTEQLGNLPVYAVCMGRAQLVKFGEEAE